MLCFQLLNILFDRHTLQGAEAKLGIFLYNNNKQLYYKTSYFQK